MGGGAQHQQALVAGGRRPVEPPGGRGERAVAPGGDEQHRDPQPDHGRPGVQVREDGPAGQADHPGDGGTDPGRRHQHRRPPHRRADQHDPGHPAPAQLGDRGDHVVVHLVLVVEVEDQHPVAEPGVRARRREPLAQVAAALVSEDQAAGSAAEDHPDGVEPLAGAEPEGRRPLAVPQARLAVGGAPGGRGRAGRRGGDGWSPAFPVAAGGAAGGDQRPAGQQPGQPTPAPVHRGIRSRLRPGRPGRTAPGRPACGQPGPRWRWRRPGRPGGRGRGGGGR